MAVRFFGFALYVWDNMVGYMTLDGWVSCSDAEHLRDGFWRYFGELVKRGGGCGVESSYHDIELVQVARLAQLLIQNGVPNGLGCENRSEISPTSIESLDAPVLNRMLSPRFR